MSHTRAAAPEHGRGTSSSGPSSRNPSPTSRLRTRGSRATASEPTTGSHPLEVLGAPRCPVSARMAPARSRSRQEPLPAAASTTTSPRQGACSWASSWQLERHPLGSYGRIGPRSAHRRRTAGGRGTAPLEQGFAVDDRDLGMPSAASMCRVRRPGRRRDTRRLFRHHHVDAGDRRAANGLGQGTAAGRVLGLGGAHRPVPDGPPSSCAVRSGSRRWASMARVETPVSAIMVTRLATVVVTPAPSVPQ